MITTRSALCALVLTCPLPAQLSTQQLARIDPDPNDLALSDAFGDAIDLSATTLVVGAPLHDPNGLAQAGSVYVFVASGTNWVQQAKLSSSTLDDGDRFGWSVGIDGDTIVAGAPLDSGAAGSAFVFVRQAGLWIEQAHLVASDTTTFDRFGSDVAIAGDTIAVGAEFVDVGGATFAGAVYVFTRSGSTWSEQAKLVASDGEAFDVFGQTVAIDGDRIAVGAPDEDAGGMNAGAIYTFERTGTVWAETAKLQAGDAAAGDHLGRSLAVHATTILAGAPSAASNTGAAYVFEDGPGGWAEQAKLTENGAPFADRFGTAVDVEGDRAVVGLPINSIGGVGTGAVELFVRSGTQWTSQTQMIGSDSSPNDFLGSSAALAGNLVAAGAPGADTAPTGLPTGEAYLFAIVPPPLVEAYCAAKTNSLGCVPTVTWSGLPSASNPSAFEVGCMQVLGFKPGLWFYGLAPAALPFQGGLLCVAPPLKRTSLQNSLGSPPPPESCTGSYGLDVNQLIQGGGDPALAPGSDVYGQYWMRDPGSPIPTALSNGVHFVIDP